MIFLFLKNYCLFLMGLKKHMFSGSGKRLSQSKLFILKEQNFPSRRLCSPLLPFSQFSCTFMDSLPPVSDILIFILIHSFIPLILFLFHFLALLYLYSFLSSVYFLLNFCLLISDFCSTEVCCHSNQFVTAVFPERYLQCLSIQSFSSQS